MTLYLPGHVAEDAGDDADDGEGDPEGAQGVGDHHEADQHHEAGRDQHALDGLGLDLQVLVNVDEERVEYRDLEYHKSGFLTHLGHSDKSLYCIHVHLYI